MTTVTSMDRARLLAVCIIALNINDAAAKAAGRERTYPRYVFEIERLAEAKAKESTDVTPA